MTAEGSARKIGGRCGVARKEKRAWRKLLRLEELLVKFRLPKALVDKG